MIFIAGRKVRRKTILWWLGLGLAAFVTVEIILAGGGEQQLPPPQPITLRQGKIVGNRLVSKAWSLDYRSIVSSPDGTTVDVDGVTGGLIIKNGKPYLHFKAAHVNANTISSDLNVTGKVHIETIGGKIKHTFDTSIATWNNALGLLVVPNQATIGSDADVLRVSAMTYNINTGEVKVKGIHGDVKF